MKGFLKYVFFLMLLCSYTATSFEVNDKECKQNYGKEIHTYIKASEATNVSSVHTEKIVELFTSFYDLLFPQHNSEQTFFCSVSIEPDPPNKIYLRYRSLLI